MVVNETGKPARWGVMTLRVMNALEQDGPMTRVELCKMVGTDKRTASSIVSRLVKSGRVHIAAWRDDAEGARRYIRAVYAAGAGKNAPKPNQRKRQLEQKRRAWAKSRAIKLGPFAALVPIQPRLNRRVV